MRRGFTLIELIVVIAIIAILAAIIAPSAFKAIEKAKISKAVTDFKVLKTAAYALYADTGEYPAEIIAFIQPKDSDVLSDVHSYSGWDGPYLGGDPDPHPWGGIYRYAGVDMGRGTNCDLSVALDYYCYSNIAQANCGVSQEVMIKIDETLDNGNLSTGNMREITWLASGQLRPLHWALFWDVFSP